MSQMRRRRNGGSGGNGAAVDGQAAAGRAAAVGEAADPTAPNAEAVVPAAEPSAAEVPVPSTPLQETQLIGQELVLASEALVPLSANRTEATPVPTRNQIEMDTSVTRQEERFQTPAHEVTQTPNGHGGSQELDRQVAIPRTPVEDHRSGPVGQPVSLGPPAQTPQNMLPLFTPDQVMQMQRMEDSAPWLYQRLRAPAMAQSPLALTAGGGDQQPALHQPGIESVLQELQDQRMSEAMWKSQVEQMMSQLGLQLRASQMENARLKEEVKFWREKPSSSYHTPEDGPRGRQALGGKIEDGPRGQQDRCGNEDGPRGQQGLLSPEDGLVSQQARREEIVRAQELLLREREQARLQEEAQAPPEPQPSGNGYLPHESEEEEEDGSEDQARRSSFLQLSRLRGAHPKLRDRTHRPKPWTSC